MSRGEVGRVPIVPVRGRAATLCCFCSPVDTDRAQTTIIISRVTPIPAAFHTMNSAPLETRMNAVVTQGHAYAKINLSLDVLGRRPDGFHDLRSLVIGVDLCDEIRLSKVDGGSFTLSCSHKGIAQEENLAFRAAVRLANELSIEPSGFLELTKSIPVGAGLGGGSSDAAMTLRVCNDTWNGGLSDPDLAAIGAELGSDVPLFFSLPSAVFTGRGERVEQVSMRWSGWALLVFVDELVSTAKVFEAWRPEDSAGCPSCKDEAIGRCGSADEMTALLSNHLEPAVFRVSPRTERVFRELQRDGIGPMSVTGAGSTLFRLFDKKGTAQDVARRIEHLGLGVTTMVAEAPAGPSPIVIEES